MSTRPHTIFKLSRSIVAACWLACGASTVWAAPQTMELFASGGTPSTTGPLLGTQTNTYFLNTDNPTGNAQVAVTPPLTVTYSFENQVFGGTDPATSGIKFGDTNTTIYIPLAQQGAPLSNMSRLTATIQQTLRGLMSVQQRLRPPAIMAQGLLSTQRF